MFLNEHGNLARVALRRLLICESVVGIHITAHNVSIEKYVYTSSGYLFDFLLLLLRCD
jgi:hypothetical protein